MRRESAHKRLKETPPETKQFVRKYADIIIRINQLLSEKKMTQATLAEKMGKKPSEISRWLNGQHNLTLLSLCKLEVELEADIIHVPHSISFETIGQAQQKFTVYKNDVQTGSNVLFMESVPDYNSKTKTFIANAS